MKFSIIIPIYNASEFLKECLDSIVNQSFENYEVLMIDDGSTDESVKICEEYLCDKRFLLLQKQNGGVSSARNMGIDHATGEYLLFVDADDLLVTESLRLFAAALAGNRKDVVFGRTATFTKDCADYDMNNGPFQETASHQENENLMYLWTNKYITNCVWGNVYDTGLVKKYALQFDETLSMGEDGDWLYQFLLHARSYAYLNDCIYLYRRDEEASNFCKTGYKYAHSSWVTHCKWYDYFDTQYTGKDREEILSRYANGYVFLPIRILPLNKADRAKMKEQYVQKDYILKSCSGRAKIYARFYRLFGFHFLAGLVKLYATAKGVK